MEEWLGNELSSVLGAEIETICLCPLVTECHNGIFPVHLAVSIRVIRLDS